jgi:hypothetical protein
MSSSMYQAFETDEKVEKEGLWVEFPEVVNKDGNILSIRIARAGGANDAYLKKLEFKAKPHRRGIQNDMIDRKLMEKIVKEVYCDTVILDWKHAEDRQGNPLPFTPANALQVMNDLPWLYAQVMEESTRFANFRKHIREEDAKN